MRVTDSKQDSKQQKVLVVFGTRPEAIKLAPVVSALQSRPDLFLTKSCATAQHRGLLDQVLQRFDISPDYDLDIMQDGQDLFQITTRCMERLRPVLVELRPDWVLVQGDTTTTFAAALSAFYLGIRVGHIEAGLRSGDKKFPFPEEANRTLTTNLAEIHFAPTVQAKENLVREGISKTAIHITGNTGIDAMMFARQQMASEPLQVPGLEDWDGRRPLILVTGHRRENFGKSIQNIVEALRVIAGRGDVDIVYPLHPNPNVSKPVRECLHGVPNIHLIAPVDFFSFVQLMDCAKIIVTDSGGIQEEAPALGKPVLIMREVTERQEAIKAGAAKLVGTRTDSIVSETFQLLDNPELYAEMSVPRTIFGDGQASKRIVDILAAHPHRHLGRRRPAKTMHSQSLRFLSVAGS